MGLMSQIQHHQTERGPVQVALQKKPSPHQPGARPLHLLLVSPWEHILPTVCSQGNLSELCSGAQNPSSSVPL